ncbi:DNA-binding protein [Rhodonellum psychrophilum GCM71 = DSM 17998]|uniref:DNA-binding protein n=2 Tax=Rhodonellum TaxID=336827 RepID=U5BT88_9BACT|nr:MULTISPECIES: KilA-N domain-containing protein [Rhodonellum]ERM81118.1 DNA-binding protein [Rhodonellum psychrophilum GCM71 = DSM 17998]SDZ51514.1 KilA-N domain-containing protein [Rhodonellum ikkaensis]
MSKNHKIEVQGIAVWVTKINEDDYISLTDIARQKDATRSDYILQNWMRNRSTLEYLGLWEHLNNPDFNSIEFDGIKNQAGSNSFSMTPKRWIEQTNAIGIFSKTGRYGGTFAHRDIAFEFASWISAEFKLYLVVEFQRLKKEEEDPGKLTWNFQRMLSKVNYAIHTDAVKEKLIPQILNPHQIKYVYADEADILNMALFGMTAREWRTLNPNEKGNIRDMASIEQLVVLSNMESINAMLIHNGMTQAERLKQLNEISISQMTSLLQANGLKKLK